MQSIIHLPQIFRTGLFLALLIIVGVNTDPIGSATSADEPQPRVSESEFLADADVVVAPLKQIKISALDLSERRRPSFIRRMERANKTDLKQAKFSMLGRRFLVLLGERPEREFFLGDVERKGDPYWWGAWSLYSYHLIDGRFYEFMLVEQETKIACRPYRGDLGVLEVGAGDRTLEKVSFKGSIKQEGRASAPVGTISERYTEAVQSCRMPVGDYTAYLLSVSYDNLRLSLSHNYHTNAQGKPALENVVYGMQVCKDKPYVLDLSNDPLVVFHTPAQDKTRFSRGDEIKFAAVLIDPKLDVMIRGLDDTSVKVEKKTSNGHTYKDNKSLDPKVVIARANGEIVAEGVMPFG